ncbi:MAG TPA: efflux RND transporter periplasmic adaptor subunit, partial [Planctomycetaceae bacterium]|nr:efflux RND transporter periplasmic adaptor subunit [Planctomycetaceae bacterium]
MTADQFFTPGWIASHTWTIAGWTMLHFLWVGAAIGLAAAVVRVLMRRAGPEWRYVAGLAFFALSAAAPAGIAVGVSQSLVFQTRPDPPGEWSRAAPALDGSTAAVRVSSQPADETPSTAFGLADEVGREPVAAAAGGRASSPFAAEVWPSVEAAAPSASHFDWHRRAIDAVVRVVPAVWIAGSSLLLAVTFAGLHGGGRLKRNSRLLMDGEIVGRCSTLAGSLGIARRVALAVCDRLAGPVLVGVVRPCILLPPAALSGWTPQQLDMVLLHELAHIRRWDNLVNLVQRLVESVLFFQPGVWWISGWIRLEREHCCDEAVVRRTGRRREYAQVLLMLSGIDSDRASVVCVSMARTHLVPRVRRLLQKGPEPMQTSRFTTLLVAAALAAVALLPLGVHQITIGADEAPPAASEPDDGDPAGDSDGPREQPSPSVRHGASPSEEDRASPSRAASADDTSEPPETSPNRTQGKSPAPDEAAIWPIEVLRARVSPGQSLTLAARRDGVLESVPVREGASVKKGQVLASQPSDPLRIAEIDLQHASKALEQAEAEHAQARASNERLKRSVPEAELLRRKLDFERSALQVERAQAEHAALKDALTIRAPIDGIVSRLYRQPGESVKAGEPVAQLINTDQMQVEGEIDFSRMWTVRPGAPVELRVSDVPELDLPVERERFTGEITFVDASVHPVSQTVKIRAVVQNRDGLLKAGLPVELAILQPRR